MMFQDVLCPGVKTSALMIYSNAKYKLVYDPNTFYAIFAPKTNGIY